MGDFDKLIEQLKRHEGFRAEPYRCSAGKWTIGYGFNLDAKGIDHEGLRWNESLAEDVLVDCVAGMVQGEFPLKDLRGVVVDVVRFLAVVNMIFNMGASKVSKFENMVAALVAKDYDLAAKEMLDSNWAKQVGARAIELSEQMRTGEWQF